MESPVSEPADLAPAVPHTPSRNLLLVAWQRRSLVLFGLVAGCATGLLLYSQKHPVYQSSAQVLVVKKHSDALPVAGGDARMAFYEDYVGTHLVLLRSPLIAELAVKKRDLGSLKSLAGDSAGTVRAGLTAGRDNTKDANSAPNNIINLTYRGGDAADCAAVLSAVIDSYRDFLDEAFRNVSENSLQEVAQAAVKLRATLEQKQVKYEDFRKKAPLLWTGSDGANLYRTRIKEFQGRQTALLARAAELRQRLLAVESADKSTPLADLLRLATPSQDKEHGLAPSLEKNLEEQLFPLLLKERALLQDYGADYPEVIRVREQIVMTREYFGRLDRVTRKGGHDVPNSPSDPLESQLMRLRQELALVETSSAALTKLIGAEEKPARELDLIVMQDEGFRNDIARTSKFLEQMEKRLEEVQVVHNYGGYEAKVIASPAAGVKVAPLAWQILPSGAVLGLLAGLVLAYLLDVLDKSFRTPEEIRRRLGLPVIGHVPMLTAGIRDDHCRLDPLLVAHHRPTSPDAESYRGVRTALYFGTRAERHKVIQVTSPQMGDGKSLLIANLAVSMAQSGRRVVLVDGDMRRGRLHRIFGLTARTGLAAVVAGKEELTEAVQETEIPNLSVLPCGPRPANPAELLTDPRFEEVLEDLRAAYDFVLVDTPPLLAVSDPCTVAPRVDGVLFVLRPGKNGRPPAERARDLLAESNARVFGVVVNGVGKAGAGYGYEHYAPGYEYAAEYTEAAAEADPTPEPDEALAGVAAAEGNGHAPEPLLSFPPKSR